MKRITLSQIKAAAKRRVNGIRVSVCDKNQYPSNMHGNYITIRVLFIDGAFIVRRYGDDTQLDSYIANYTYYNDGISYWR